MIRRIIQRMKQLLDTYRFVKLCRKLIDEAEIKTPPEFRLVGFQGAHAVTAAVKRDFMKKYSKATLSKVSYTCVDAIKNGYLEATDAIHEGQKLDTLCITTRGRKLIDIPIGTLQEFLSEYGLVVTFVTGGAFTGLVILIWRIIVSM